MHPFTRFLSYEQYSILIIVSLLEFCQDKRKGNKFETFKKKMVNAAGINISPPTVVRMETCFFGRRC